MGFEPHYLRTQVVIFHDFPYWMNHGNLELDICSYLAEASFPIKKGLNPWKQKAHLIAGQKSLSLSRNYPSQTWVNPLQGCVAFSVCARISDTKQPSPNQSGTVLHSTAPRPSKNSSVPAAHEKFTTHSSRNWNTHLYAVKKFYPNSRQMMTNVQSCRIFQGHMLVSFPPRHASFPALEEIFDLSSQGHPAIRCRSPWCEAWTNLWE